MTNSISNPAEAGVKPTITAPPNDGWPELIPLTGTLAPAGKFPLDELPDRIKEPIEQAATIIQVPISMAANSFLAAGSGMVQGHADISIDWRNFPISENHISIAESGDRKDTIDNVATGPIREYELVLQDKIMSLLQKYQDELDAYTHARKKALKNCKTREQSIAALKELGTPPEPPLTAAKIIPDFTIEGLMKAFQVGQPSVLILATEGGILLGGYGFSNEKILGTVTGLSNIWDGKPVTRVRAGDGLVMFCGKRATSHLMVQPILAPLLVSNSLLAGQGWLWRNLIAYPETLAGTRMMDEDDTEVRLNIANCKELQGYREHAKQLLAHPEPLRENSRNELQPRRLELAQDALRVWRSFYNDIEREQRREGRFSSIKGFASRAAEHAARLAGSLALFDDIECSNIGADYVTAGIILVQFYLDEMLRLHGTGNISDEVRQALELWHWLRAKRKDEVSLVEIMRYGPPAMRRESEITRATLWLLKEHGYLKMCPDGIEFDGKIRKEAFRVRPEEI